MTDDERTVIAESLFAVIFSMRPTASPEAGQAWALSIATTVMSRAILGSVGPAGDPGPLLTIAHERVVAQVTEAQTKFYRDKLTVGRG